MELRKIILAWSGTNNGIQKSELVDRLLLHVRTDNYEGFCSAVDSGFQQFGQKELYNSND